MGHLPEYYYRIGGMFEHRYTYLGNILLEESVEWNLDKWRKDEAQYHWLLLNSPWTFELQWPEVIIPSKKESAHERV